MRGRFSLCRQTRGDGDGEPLMDGELIYRFEELIREIDSQLSRAAGPPDRGRDVFAHEQ
jgi:hypothetical protein